MRARARLCGSGRHAHRSPGAERHRIVTLLDGRAALATPRANSRSEEGALETASRRALAPAPQPMLIAAGAHTCLAWWHAPVSGMSHALPLAVVLASSWGEEDMAAYDNQRALATALAEGGLGTLRFEWPDTGDSSAETGTTTVDDALTAFDAAARQALALSGRERLAFVGLRLGALLAAHAAAARLDVDALVALMPVPGGGAFVREQRVLSAVAPKPLPGASFDPAELPVSLGGFALSVRRLEALSALRWPRAATTSVLEALLLWPPQKSDRAAADALARMGTRVHEWAMEDPSGDLAIARIVRWLREHAVDATVTRGVAEIEDFGIADAGNRKVNARLATAQLEAATAALLDLSTGETSVWMRLHKDGVAVRERVVRVADAQGLVLVGVLSERDRFGHAIDATAPRQGVVLLSSGRDRRIGPHRLWVPWARHRAALGDVVLRMDIAGIGDSAPDSRPDAHAVGDLARVLDWLRREQGVGACTVVGVGSGAALAWRAALDGVDVQRIVAVDPTALRRREQGARESASAASTPRALAARARHALRRRARGVARLLRWRLEEGLVAEMLRACARGVSLNLVFSRGAHGHALLRDEAGRRAASLARDSRLTVCTLANAGQGFAGVADRAALYAGLDALVSSPVGPLSC